MNYKNFVKEELMAKHIIFLVSQSAKDASLASFNYISLQALGSKIRFE